MALMHTFSRVARFGGSVVSGTRSLSHVLVSMRNNNENVDGQMETLEYMTKHLYLVFDRADIALSASIVALHR